MNFRPAARVPACARRASGHNDRIHRQIKQRQSHRSLKLRGLNGVHHQHIDMGQHRFRMVQIEGGGRVNHFDASALGCARYLGAMGGFVLHQQDIAEFGRFQHAQAVLKRQRAIGPSMKEDRILALRINHHNCRSCSDVGQNLHPRYINPGRRKLRQHHRPILPHRSKMEYIRARPRRSDGLIGPFAPQFGAIALRRQCLAGGG